MHSEKEERGAVATSYPKHLYIMAYKEFPFTVCFILDTQEQANTLKDAVPNWNYQFDEILYCAEHDFWECRFLARYFSNSYLSQVRRALDKDSLAFVVEPNF